MAKDSVMAGARPSPFTRLRDFFQEVKTEVAKVAWPSKDELKQNTQIVLLVLAIFAIIIFVYDTVFNSVVIGFLNLLG